jgi:hypothetical protein
VKIGILTRQRGWHVTALEEALMREGVMVERFSITRLLAQVAALPHLTYRGRSLDDYAALLVRSIPTGCEE